MHAATCDSFDKAASLLIVLRRERGTVNLKEKCKTRRGEYVDERLHETRGPENQHSLGLWGCTGGDTRGRQEIGFQFVAPTSTTSALTRA